MLRGVRIVPAGLGRQGAPALEILDLLAPALARVLWVSVHVDAQPLEVGFAADAVRGQYHATAILARLAQGAQQRGVPVLAVTDLDLYVPILTFVFGEAQLAGNAAVVSTCRLRDEFYGLPPDPEKLGERLFRESLHELGHTQGLRHCPDWSCGMSSAHSVERIDLRATGFCAECSRLFGRGF